MPFQIMWKFLEISLYYNKEDEAAGTFENLLINSTEISFDGLWDLVRSFDGVMFPAHLDKNANSLLSNLGFIPPDSRFMAAEVRNWDVFLN